MYNGWPASFGDIAAGLTFRRKVADKISDDFHELGGMRAAVLLGPSGVGKSTAARQALSFLSEKGFYAWEHKEDQTLSEDRWLELARYLHENNEKGVLLIDDAHSHLRSINGIIEKLHQSSYTSLRLILVSTNHNWGPRIKSPILTKNSLIYALNTVTGEEIDHLLDLVERNSALRALVETDFSGYTRGEKRRRLIQSCESDMFVCLKNIFSSEKFDDIILREYAQIEPELQEIYKIVAAMESAGVHVHRQFVIRMLGLRANLVSSILLRLEDILHEQTVDERKGIYAWRGRHKVIMGIVAEHKYYDTNKRYDLFDQRYSEYSANL